MLVDILFISFGFLILIFGAHFLVNGSIFLAIKFNISDIAIGLTVVAFGTSAPELVVNSIASLDGHSDIVYGNIIGSNVFNLFVILGLVGLIKPIVVQHSTVWKEIPISLLVIVLLLILSNDFYVNQEYKLSQIDGLILCFCFLGFNWYVFRKLKNEPESSVSSSGESSNYKIAVYILFGLIGLIMGGKLVVDHAVEVALQMGLSQKIIGLTIIAAGTSLPELVTSIVSAFKKNSDIAIANVIGSNIFNILLILPVSAFLNPVTYNSKFNLDMYLLLGGTAFVFIAMFTGIKKRIDRWEAGILILVFIGYSIRQMLIEN